MTVQLHTPLSTRERADRLHAFVAKQNPLFSVNAAQEVVEQTAAQLPSATKELARAVRSALAAHGVALSHMASLQAASRMQGYSDYFHTPKPQPALVFIDLAHPAQEHPVEDWRACAAQLSDACEGWLKANPTSRMLALNVTMAGLTVSGIKPDASQEDSARWPIAVVRPCSETHDWLEGIGSAVETLRRRIEVPRRAVIDGAAVIDYCSMRKSTPTALAFPSDPVPADAAYSDLVLWRQDNEFDQGYEVARGNEVACWKQLVHEFESGPVPAFTVDDDGRWITDGALFMWEVVRLRPKEYVPGLIRGNLPPEQSRHLLKRFSGISRMPSETMMDADHPKHIPEIDAPPTHCRLDGHRVLRALRDRNESWEQFCATIGAPELSLVEPVAFGQFLALAEHLDHEDPVQLLLRPTRMDLVRVDDDHLLRALMPRVTRVRHRVPAGFDPTLHETVRDALTEFNMSLQMRRGVFDTKPQLPDAIYAGEGEDLRLILEELGLVMYVCILPNLIRVPENIRGTSKEVAPYAYGSSLFVDIDFAR